MNQLLYGIVSALDDGRTDDAVMLAQMAMDEADDPTMPLLSMAVIARLMRNNPSMPPGLLATMETTEIDGESITGATVGNEFLDVLTDMLESPGDSISAESEAILDRFKLRPGSPLVIRQIALLTAAMLSDIRTQLFILSVAKPEAITPTLLESFEPEKITAHAIAAARDAIND